MCTRTHTHTHTFISITSVVNAAEATEELSSVVSESHGGVTGREIRTLTQTPPGSRLPGL